MQVAICMKVSSSMIWHKVSEFISMPTAVSMLVIGTKISNTDSERRNGTMVVSTWASTRMHRKRAKENTAGPMATATSVNGRTICSTAKDCSCGTMTDYISVIGKIT